MFSIKTAFSRRSDAVPPASEDDPISPEIYRQIYASLNLPPDAHSVIGVTSAIAGEGRTTIALGLARTLASDLDSMVTLVEVDLQRPSLARHFRINSSPGLCEVLRGEKRLSDVRCLVDENLCVVPAGAFLADAVSLLRQLPINDPFRSAPGLRGSVILDLPPVLNHGYSRLAARAADALLLVVRAGVTPANVVREAIEQLGDRPPQGVVLNGEQSSLPSWWSDRS